MFAQAVGRLTAEPKGGTSPKGTDYVRFILAENDRDGKVFYHAVWCYGSTKTFARGLQKGDAVLVTGRAVPWLEAGQNGPVARVQIYADQIDGLHRLIGGRNDPR